MARIIMEIPNQRFYFMANYNVDEDGDNIRVDFSGEYSGTICLMTDVIDGDEDALVPFGVPDGESTGRVAFWLQIEKFSKLWNKMIKEKQKCLKED